VPALTAYIRGGCVVLDADTANTGAATINLNSLGAVAILTHAGATPADGDIPANKPVTVCYNGTQFILQGGSGGSGAGASIVATAFSATPTFTATSNTGTTFN